MSDFEFKAEQDSESEDSDEMDCVAPPGWEKTIKKMKKSGDIDNPWALAWFMHKKKYKPSKDADANDNTFNKDLQAALAHIHATGMPELCLMAAAGHPGAQLLLLDATTTWHERF